MPINTVVNIKLTKTADSFFISRDGVITASVAFSGILSPISTTTIGYSEDFRYPHASFALDNIKLNGQLLTGVYDYENDYVLISPNPVTSNLNIKLNVEIKNFELSVFDAIGKKIFDDEIIGSSTIINTSNFPSGMYFMNIESSKGRIVKKILVK